MRSNQHELTGQPSTGQHPLCAFMTSTLPRVIARTCTRPQIPLRLSFPRTRPQIFSQRRNDGFPLIEFFHVSGQRSGSTEIDGGQVLTDGEESLDVSLLDIGAGEVDVSQRNFCAVDLLTCGT